MKMKVGRDPTADGDRVRAARAAIGPASELFVDANGAYSVKLAMAMAEDFAGSGVSWFEEPVSSDDLQGLRFIRERIPAPVEVAAGEYGYELQYFDEMIAAGAVDVLQADATRCCGITGFMKAAVLCESRSVPLSAHCAPSLHVHPGCAALPLRHLEYFYDHVRIESMLFDGVLAPRAGSIYPDLSRPGIGVELKFSDAKHFEVSL